LTNSGWQYEGSWNTSAGNFLGTPIAPTFFLAAHHVEGTTGSVFVLNGFSYHTVAFFDCPDSDLRIWQVAETFPFYAPLYTATDEVGKHCVVFGRGTQRGDAVVVEPRTNGWKWGAVDSVERWGENDVSSIANGGAGLGQFLRCKFDRNGGSNECHLSRFDSSGALFIQSGSTWKLAGIHYAVDEQLFSLDGTTNTQFEAALLDQNGLYQWNGSGWNPPPSVTSTDNASAFYSTRISTNLSWINSHINFEPGNDLRMAGIQIVGSDVQLHLSTGSNRVYRVEHTSDLSTGVWTTVTNNLIGDGSIMTIVDPGGGNQPQQFYRAALLQ
jgi:hypothetical protein